MPRLRPDEVLVQVVASGVCASELESWLAAHRGARRGTSATRSAGSSSSSAPRSPGRAAGDRVGVWVDRTWLRRAVAVRADYCFPAGDGPLDEALAEPIACAVNAVELADVRLGDDVVVIGAGFMGQLVQRLVALRGYAASSWPTPARTRWTRAAAAGRHPGRRPVVGRSLPDVVRELTGRPRRGRHLRVHRHARPRWSRCGETTRMSGKIAIVGFHQGAPREVPLGYWNWMAFTIVNGHFRDVVHDHARDGRRHAPDSSGLSRLAGLVTHRFPLDEHRRRPSPTAARQAGRVRQGE